MKDCLVSFGSNLGDSQLTIDDALAELRLRIHEYENHEHENEFRVSDYYSTRPIGGPTDQRVFINGAVYFQSSLEPRKILELLHSIERSHGRERRIRWDSRTLDLDLLIYGDTILFDEGFLLPHPRMCFRQFVLQPAAQIAPELVHPICSVSMQVLLDAVQQREFDILLATSAEKVEAISELVQKEKPYSALKIIDWTKLPEIAMEPANYKLVALDIDSNSAHEILEREKNIIAWQKGPVVLLAEQTEDKLVGELTAAIDAMDAI